MTFIKHDLKTGEDKRVTPQTARRILGADRYRENVSVQKTFNGTVTSFCDDCKIEIRR